MNRALLKQDAKEAMSLANPHPVIVTLVVMAVSIAASMILGAFTSVFELTGAATGSTVLIAVGGLISVVLSIAVSLLLGTVEFGYTVYTLKVFKREYTGIGELFAYFPMAFKVFGLSLWIGLFTMLWSCLFWIPGIIAALRYSQAFYILAENPDMSIRECVNRSKMMMSGRLWEYFVLELSFILWALLTVVTCGIAGIYVTPYTSVTLAGYYLSLKPADIPYRNYDSDNAYDNQNF